MEIRNLENAQRFLDYCGYYRFCGYALAFEIQDKSGARTHKYTCGSSFEMIESIYHFDGALRRILFHYITLIEVFFRTTLTNISALHYSCPHWFLKQSAFSNPEKHSAFLDVCKKETERSKEAFIKTYSLNYEKPTLPPIWMMAELLSFTEWSKLFSNLSDEELKNKIAARVGVPAVYLPSWLKSLTVLRNSCAHHARIWNRDFTSSPKLMESMKSRILPGMHRRVAVVFLVISKMLKPINRQCDFKKDILALFVNYPTIDTASMGFSCSIDDLLAGV